MNKRKKLTKSSIIEIIFCSSGIIILGLLFYSYYIENFNAVKIEEHPILYQIFDACIFISMVLILILYHKFGGIRAPINRFKSSKK